MVLTGLHEEKPLMARFDTSAEQLKGRYSIQVGVAVPINDPTPEGWPTPEEDQQLAKIELPGGDQAVLVLADAPDKPVLLFLHCGPGNSEMPLVHTWAPAFTNDFVLVLWDQRGAGRSYDPESPPQVSLDGLVEDGAALVAYLSEHHGNGRVLVMLFQKPSTRTRLSFEAGMTRLGGHAAFVQISNTQFDKADIEDETRCIARYADAIMARLKRHSDLEHIAHASSVPVINGLTEKYHPCQALADLLTMKEDGGVLKGKTLSFFGIQNNVSNSLVNACTKVGMRVILATPENSHTPF